jgi:hypothetical protein
MFLEACGAPRGSGYMGHAKMRNVLRTVKIKSLDPKNLNPNP